MKPFIELSSPATLCFGGKLRRRDELRCRRKTHLVGHGKEYLVPEILPHSLEFTND